MNPDQRIRDEAIGWATRTADPLFDDWDAFTTWLAHDPSHARAYDEVQLALDDAVVALAEPPASHPPAPLPANDVGPPVSGFARWPWLGAAIAASLLLVIGALLWPGMQRGETYRTANGETRLIALADGSQVRLGGGSQLVVADKRKRHARLTAGQALFTVRHDAANPFVLEVANQRLVDAGTIFDVKLDAGEVDLAVAEGAVIVDPEALNLRVDAGKRAIQSGRSYRLVPVDPAEVGEWSRGRITFRDASPADIAVELSRATGVAFVSADTASDARLSGSIALDRVRQDPRALEPILGLKLRQAGDRWVIATD